MAGSPGSSSSGSARLERWAWYSVALNVGLAAAHALVALASGSLAVTAELTHNVADLASAGAVVAGLKLATRRSERFPYGLHKVENVIAAGVAGLVFVTAFEIGRGALSGRVQPVEVDRWMPAVVLVTAVVPLVFSRFELRVARDGNSPALIADAKEYRVHAATTCLVLVSLVAAEVDLPIDRWRRSAGICSSTPCGSCSTPASTAAPSSGSAARSPRTRRCRRSHGSRGATPADSGSSKPAWRSG
jgi:cation diffusion facilitator family transporter